MIPPARVRLSEHIGRSLIHATVREDLVDAAVSALRRFDDAAVVDGAEIDLGWGPVRLRASDTGLVAHAPDYRSMFPRQDETVDLTDTLWAAAVQDELHRASGLPIGRVTGFNQSIYIVDGARTRDVVCIRREETGSSRFSGWLVDTAVPPEPGSHRGAALVNKAYSLFTTHPAFLATLNLPAGYVAVAQHGRLTAVHDHTGALVFDGPSLAADLP